MFNAVLLGGLGRHLWGKGRRGDHAKPGDHVFLFWAVAWIACGNGPDPLWAGVSSWRAFLEVESGPRQLSEKRAWNGDSCSIPAPLAQPSHYFQCFNFFSLELVWEVGESTAGKVHRMTSQAERDWLVLICRWLLRVTRNVHMLWNNSHRTVPSN